MILLLLDRMFAGIQVEHKIILILVVVFINLLVRIAIASSVTLDWDPVTTHADGTPLTDLAGYTVYQSTVSFNRGGVWISTSAVSGDSLVTQYNVSGGTNSYAVNSKSGQTYFRLSAYDQQGIRSGFNVDASGNDVEVSTMTPVVGIVCDTNGDGLINVADAQTDINAALGIIPCIPACDINSDGKCTVNDVQRVINALLGGPCVTTP
jgi:Dockerin type I domain